MKYCSHIVVRQIFEKKQQINKKKNLTLIKINYTCINVNHLLSNNNNKLILCKERLLNIYWSFLSS